MKVWLGLLSIFFTLTACASLGPPETDRQFIEADGSRNILANPGFENGLHGWNLVSPASVFGLLKNASTVAEGNRSLYLLSGGSNEGVESDLYDIPPGLWGKTCLMKVDYLWSTGVAGDMALKVLDHSSSVIATTNLTTATQWKESKSNFICPAAGKLKLRVVTAAAKNKQPALHIDSAYLGVSQTLAPTATQVQTSNAQPLGLHTAFLDNNSTACSVASQYGTWIASGASGGTGICTFTFSSNIFTSAPTCFCTTKVASASDGSTCNFEATVSTSSVQITTYNSSASPTGKFVYLTCIGPN